MRIIIHHLAYKLADARNTGALFQKVSLVLSLFLSEHDFRLILYILVVLVLSLVNHIVGAQSVFCFVLVVVVKRVLADYLYSILFTLYRGRKRSPCKAV